MDDCSWMLFHGSHGDGNNSERSHGHEEQDVTISSPVQQQQLKQIYMLMDSEEDGCAATVPSTSSPSSTFCSISGGTPDEKSSLVLTGSTTTTASGHQSVEVSSLQMPLSPMVYDDKLGICFGNDVDTILNLDNHMTSQEPHMEQARRKNGHESSGAFKLYVRHLDPRKKLKPGACGQRAIKAALSALERMHTTRLAHRQSCRMTMIAASPPVGNRTSDQQQHVLSERKRREKINESFNALRTVLPPGTKKDKASTLIRARDYVNTLKSRVSELEEKNRMLEKSQLHGNNSGEQDDHSGGQVAVDVIRAAATSGEISQQFRLKIVVGSGHNAMDAVVTMLKCLKDIGDGRLVAMDISTSSNDLPPGKDV